MNAPFDLATVEAPFFVPLLGETFVVRFAEIPDSPAIGLELQQANPLTRASGSVPREPFSLIFKMPGGPALPQGLYEFTDHGLAEQLIFLVPIINGKREVAMEAIFN